MFRIDARRKEFQRSRFGCGLAIEVQEPSSLFDADQRMTLVDYDPEQPAKELSLFQALIEMLEGLPKRLLNYVVRFRPTLQHVCGDIQAIAVVPTGQFTKRIPVAVSRQLNQS